jgi:hypothetical protein
MKNEKVELDQLDAFRVKKMFKKYCRDMRSEMVSKVKFPEEKRYSNYKIGMKNPKFENMSARKEDIFH